MRSVCALARMCACMLSVDCLHCGCVADNEITDAGAKELADALKTNKTLHTLNLGSTFNGALVV